MRGEVNVYHKRTFLARAPEAVFELPDGGAERYRAGVLPALASAATRRAVLVAWLHYLEADGVARVAEGELGAAAGCEGRIAGAARRDLRRLGLPGAAWRGRGPGRKAVDAPGPAFWCMVDALTLPAPAPEPEARNAWSIFE